MSTKSLKYKQIHYSEFIENENSNKGKWSGPLCNVFNLGELNFSNEESAVTCGSCKRLLRDKKRYL